MSNHDNNCQAVRKLFDNLPEGSLKILQITDTHLYADTSGTLLGMNTQQTLDEVFRMTSTCGPIDMILSTGDLVHDSSVAGYQRFQKIMEQPGVPVYCLPGNHDAPEVMRATLVDSKVSYIPMVIQGNWLFVFLDSTLADSEGGSLSQKELDMLQATLSKHPDKHALVCLHHHPVPVGSKWMDTMLVDNAADFFNIIDRHNHVKGILWGHIHQVYEQVYENERNQVALLASPSTCIQFTPEKDTFGLDHEPPGCRWLALLPNGEIRSCVTRLSQMPAGLDFNSVGY